MPVISDYIQQLPALAASEHDYEERNQSAQQVHRVQARKQIEEGAVRIFHQVRALRQ